VPSRHLLFVIGGRVLPPKMAFGAEFANRSAGLAIAPAASMGQNGKLIALTSDQWQFLRGVYAMNLEAPPGLPYGDNAVLAQDMGDSDDLLFFVEGDKLCAPMHAPPGLLSLMNQVVMAEISQHNVGSLGRRPNDACGVVADE
jgi:hypothetical protein